MRIIAVGAGGLTTGKSSLTTDNQYHPLVDRKAAIRKYKETATPMGVFCVRHKANGKAFVGSSTNLPAMLNRQKFQLEHGSHANRELQKEWNELGSDAFTIETLDTMEPKQEPGYDPADDLKALEEMWRETLARGGGVYSR